MTTPPSADPLPRHDPPCRRALEALVRVASAQARERGGARTVVIGALVSALGCMASAVARTNRSDLACDERLLAEHFARVVPAESAPPVYR